MCIHICINAHLCAYMYVCVAIHVQVCVLMRVRCHHQVFPSITVLFFEAESVN